MPDLDLAAVRARYEENRRRRADAWRSMDDMGVVLAALDEEYVRGRAHHRDDLSEIEQHRKQVERLTAERDRAWQDAEAALVDVEHYRDRVVEAEAAAAACSCGTSPDDVRGAGARLPGRIATSEAGSE